MMTSHVDMFSTEGDSPLWLMGEKKEHFSLVAEYTEMKKN